MRRRVHMLLAALFAAGQLAGASAQACEGRQQHVGCCERQRLEIFHANIAERDCCRIQQGQAAPVVNRSIASSRVDVGGFAAIAAVAVAHVGIAASRPILDAGSVHRTRAIFLLDRNLRI